MDLYTIIGCWPESGERFAEAMESVSPAAMEAEMDMRAREMGTVFYPAAVLLGDVQMEDSYTAFIDPMDVQNEGMEGLFRPLAGSTNEEWTVFGIAWDPEHPDSFDEPIGERWSRTIMADSAWSAEDVAASFIKEEDGVLWVCGVARGTWTRADSARFVDPEL